MILIADASSPAGQKLIPILVEKGYPVRVFLRDACQLQYSRSSGVEFMEGDLQQPETLVRACKGTEAVVSSLNIDENHALIETAKRSNVKHFVLLSAYHPLSKYSFAGQLAQDQTEAYLRTSDLNYTILQPTALMEIHCQDLGIQVLNGHEVTIYGDGRNPINFVSAQDVARFIIFALEDPRLCNQIIPIGGPQNLTFEEAVLTCEKAFSKRVHRKYISAPRMKLMSMIYAPFDKTRARFMTIRHELATLNWCLDMSETIKHYPIKLEKLEEWILETLKKK